MKDNLYTIVICTYNRPQLLASCLDSIAKAMGTKPPILVVSNGPNHNEINKVVDTFSNILPIRVIAEESTGLSYARNAGAKAAQTDWLFYLDDDAKVHIDLLEVLEKTTNTADFSLLTGVYEPWFRQSKSKWLPEGFGAYRYDGELGPLPKDKHIAGGVMLVDKEKLQEIGFFPTDLGMTGSQIGYGEDTYVENAFLSKGYRVGINPEMKIDHLVREEKLTLNWHLKAALAKAKAKKKLQRLSFRQSLWLAVRQIGGFLLSSVTNLSKLFFQSNYYLGNYVLDTFSKLYRAIGFLS